MALSHAGWPVALAMTLALIMFVWGMYKYGMRIYRRFALTGDGFITGKFEIGDDDTVRRRCTQYGSHYGSTYYRESTRGARNPHHAESRPSRAYPSHSRTHQADAANYAPVPSQREGINELLSGTGIADGPNPSAPAPRKRTQEVETKPNSNPHPNSNGITTRARARARAQALSLSRPGREDHRAD